MASNSTPHSTDSTSTSDSTQASDVGTFFEKYRDYLITGLVIGCILVALVIAVILWTKRRKRLAVADVESRHDKGDGVYVEIAETSTNKKKKKKKSPRQNNNPDQAVELVALDTAPDIITAHDSDSIYETIDGRRAARAKAGHVTAQINQSGGSALPIPAGGNVDVLDPNYDHLSRYTKRRPPFPLEEQPGKRCTDPEISRRQKTQPVCRKAHSADEDSQARKGYRDLTLNRGGNNNNDDDDDNDNDDDRAVGTCDSCSRKNSPAGSVQSTTSAMAERRGAGGKRILCQLTMVGVVENGKPVPMPRRPANNAYFVLEPGSQAATLDEEESFQRLKTCKAKFQVRAHAGGGRNAGAAAAAGSSEYFVLQPLDQDAEEDLTDLNKTMSSPSLLNPEEASHAAEGISRVRRGRFSVHGQRTVSSFVELGQDVDSDSLPRQSVVFRDTRLHSCPEASPSTESSPRNSREYRRSLSSPRCSRSEEDRSSAERRVDADWLKARIQREMRALGFIRDTEPGSNHDYATAVVESDSESDDVEEDNTASETEPQTPPTRPPLGPRPPRNEYFILEPEQETCDSDDSDDEDDDETDDDDDSDDTDCKNQPSNTPVVLPVSRKAPVPKPRQNLPQTKAETSCEEKPRYQRQYTTQAVPPRLPQRNPRMAHHTRSRSETPFFKPSCPPLSGRGEEEEEQGPVVVSLKKSKSVDTSSAAATAGPTMPGVSGRGVERRESTNTRPRIKSAHSILS